MLGVEAEDILDEKFVNKKELEEEALENVKEEYDVEEIKDRFDEGAIPNQLDFFHSGINENFVQACYVLSPSNDNREIIAFLSSELDKIY